MKWPLVRLGDCCNIVSGATPKTGIDNYWGGSILWATPKDVSNLEAPWLTDTPDKITEAGYASCSTQMLPTGAVLVTSRAPIGNIAIAAKPMCTNQGFKSLVPGPAVHSGYLYHCMKANSERLQALGNGATFKEVSKPIVENFEIPLPPLEEQKRIAAILDKADSLSRKRQQAIRLADDFLRAVFLDMFGDPVTNPKGWPVVKLGALAKSDRYAIKAGPFGSALKKEFYVSSGYRVYGQEQVIRDDLTFGDYYIDEEKYRELESCKVESGDMLISLVGTFGKICIVPPDFEPGIINPRLMKISFDPLKATPRFMKALLTSDSMVRRIESLSHGGTMGIVNVGIMKDLDVPVPPVAIQTRFEEVQEKLSILRTNHDDAEEQTTLAFSALQSRFFA